MAEKKGGASKATAMNRADNAKLGDIETAAKSTMADADYEHGYPHQKDRIYQGKFSVGRGKPGGR